MVRTSLWVRAEAQGLYVAPADCWIDPSRPVDTALVTHGHADHACGGHGCTVPTAETIAIMTLRYGEQDGAVHVADGETHRLAGGVDAPFLAAGHVSGSGPMFLEYGGGGRIDTGAYKRPPDDRKQPGSGESVSLSVNIG